MKKYGTALSKVEINVRNILHSRKGTTRLSKDSVPQLAQKSLRYKSESVSLFLSRISAINLQGLPKL